MEGKMILAWGTKCSNTSLEMREHILYFSTHRPLLSITSHSTDSYAVNDVNTLPVV